MSERWIESWIYDHEDTMEYIQHGIVTIFWRWNFLGHYFYITKVLPLQPSAISVKQQFALHYIWVCCTLHWSGLKTAWHSIPVANCIIVTIHISNTQQPVDLNHKRTANATYYGVIPPLLHPWDSQLAHLSDCLKRLTAPPFKSTVIGVVQFRELEQKKNHIILSLSRTSQSYKRVLAY